MQWLNSGLETRSLGTPAIAEAGWLVGTEGGTWDVLGVGRRGGKSFLVGGGGMLVLVFKEPLSA